MKRSKSFTHASHKARRSQRRDQSLPRKNGPGDAVAGLCSHDTREASTLLIVMVLLGMLSLIGFLFLTFAANERSNAAYWAESQKVYVASEDPDTLFDWSLKQLIVGPDNSLSASALSGSGSTPSSRPWTRHSMLANMFGGDIHPYNSAGVLLGSNNGLPFVDANRDGVNDAPAVINDPLQFNDNGPAQGWINDPTQGWISARSTGNLPDSGVDYTYPDINNLFLAYKGFAIAPDGTPVQVIIPSFHRPQLLRTTNGVPVPNGGAVGSNWYDYDDTNNPLGLSYRVSGRMMRPHPNHLNPDGNTRFPTAPTGTLTSVFPFMPGTAGQQGVWTMGYSYGSAVPAYEWDVDNDGDLIKEGVWLDLQYPVQTDSLGQKYVPLFSFTVYDADGLFNLNAHGNHAGLIQLTNMGEIANLTEYISKSSQGMTSYEINPEYGLNSELSGTDFPGTTAEFNAATDQFLRQYGVRPSTPGQLANMEWYRLLAGTANFQSATSFNDLYPGRYGELSRLYAALYASTTSSSAAATLLSGMAYPGVSHDVSGSLTNGDDDWNAYEGAYNWENKSSTPATIRQYLTAPPSPYGQPLDFNANGSIAGQLNPSTMALSGSNYGKSRLSLAFKTPYRTLPLPVYLNYDNPGGASLYTQMGTSDFQNQNSIGAGWHDPSNGSNLIQGQQMVYNSSGTAVPYLTAPPTIVAPLTQIDEPSEMIVDPVHASSSDMIFPYDEMAALHLAKTDRDNLGLSSRLKTLLPFNFGASARADETGGKFAITQQFSVASWDRRQFGYAGRAWESASGTFPPNYGGTINSQYDPFRPPVRALLEVITGNTTVLKMQYRLSLNHVIAGTAAAPVQRGLTPHNPSLTSADERANVQEAMARLDRQWMARDIYVMLYTLGGGSDAINYSGDNSGFAIYSERQLREMAQFAVNVVDALDSDQVMTKFEYDKNLGNGWNVDDLAYSPPLMPTSGYETGSTFTPYTRAANPNEYNADYPEDSEERGVVYGVETQQLTISELLAFKCPKFTGTSAMDDTNRTAHDDMKDRYFTYVELRNVGTSKVRFDGQWRLRVVPAGGGIERRLTFRDNDIDPGQLYTIGNAGETDAGVAPLIGVDQNPPPPTPDDKNHSRFRADHSGISPATTDFTDSATWIAPSKKELDLDLIVHQDNNKFWLVDTKGTDDESDDVNVTSTATGGLLNENTLASPAAPADHPVTFVLERRQYPDRPVHSTDPLDHTDNDWVIVDKMTLDDGLFTFQLQFGDMRSKMDQYLDELNSWERIEPLRARTAVGDSPTRELSQTTSNVVSNSLMAENLATTTQSAPYDKFTAAQIAFDRPFASPVELFHIPLYGPQNVTKWTVEATWSPYNQTSDMDQEVGVGGLTAGQQAEIPFAASAAGKILQPEHFANLTVAAASKTQQHLDNRWYRLFEFYEVPMRMHRQLGDRLLLVRQPGKLNPNTMRHPAVLAGLVNDTDVLTFGNASSTRQTLTANDLSDADNVSGLRDWWVQFLKARDGRQRFRTNNGDLVNGTLTDVDANDNPITRYEPDNVTGLYLPGLADSSPFRSFASVGMTRVNDATNNPRWNEPATALDQTLFRRLPIDILTQGGAATPQSANALTDKRHLWEVGNNADHPNNAVDSVMRHRLLSKIYNNTTTRSHVFIVFVTVKLFEADDSAGAANVRIGGPLTNGATYRGFFVIDRSQPEDAYDSATGTFSNFRALIKHRQLLN